MMKPQQPLQLPPPTDNRRKNETNDDEELKTSDERDVANAQLGNPIRLIASSTSCTKAMQMSPLGQPQPLGPIVINLPAAQQPEATTAGDYATLHSTSSLDINILRYQTQQRVHERCCGAPSLQPISGSVNGQRIYIIFIHLRTLTVTMDESMAGCIIIYVDALLCQLNRISSSLLPHVFNR